MYNQESFLEMEIIWKDDDILELKVFASNGRYSGTTEVYDTSDSLIGFAKTLIGYPAENPTLTYQAENGRDNSFVVTFYCVDNSGHIGVQIELEERIREGQKNKIKFEINVVPSCIDNFQRELVQMATTRNGTARLVR